MVREVRMLIPVEPAKDVRWSRSWLCWAQACIPSRLVHAQTAVERESRWMRRIVARNVREFVWLTRRRLLMFP